MDERLVGVEDPVPPREQVALEPALALVLAEHRVEHASGRGEKLVVRQRRGVPLTTGHLEEGTEAVGERLVWSEDPEVALLAVELRHIAQERPEYARVADAVHPGCGHVGRVLAEIRHPQILEQHAAVGVRIGAHASFPLGREFGQLRLQAAPLIEELLWPVAPQPVLEQPEVSGVGSLGGAAPDAPERCLRSADHPPPWVPSSPWVS